MCALGFIYTAINQKVLHAVLQRVTGVCSIWMSQIVFQPSNELFLHATSINNVNPCLVVNKAPLAVSTQGLSIADTDVLKM